MSFTYKLTVAYDGASYHGFQRQPKNITVQEKLEGVLSKIFKQRTTIVASGRTDSGVHAIGQVISFVVPHLIPDRNLQRAANALLPEDIRVLEAALVASDFHARRNAVAKYYSYKIKIVEEFSPFSCRYAWQLSNHIDIKELKAATAYIVGEHDFSSFRSTGSTPTRPVRTIYLADWQFIGEDLIFHIIGNGFLYHMVRNLVSALMKVACGKFTKERFRDILNSCSREHPGGIAPAQGLYLNKVFYCHSERESFLQNYMKKLQ